MEVAPLVGAWIEIDDYPGKFFQYMVAPLVGAWIEIMDEYILDDNEQCRSSCRSVD